MRVKTKLGAALATATVVAVGAWAAVGLSGPAGATDASGAVTAVGPTVPGGTWGPAQPVPGLAALAPSGYPVVVTYGGNADFLGATSATQILTVTRAKTSTSLTLSRATITYGHENAAKLTVSVSHLSGSYATGKVTIKAGSSVVCTVSLAKGTGSCILSASKLKAGTYHLSASYGGDVNYSPSASSAKALKVAA